MTSLALPGLTARLQTRPVPDGSVPADDHAPSADCAIRTEAPPASKVAMSKVFALAKCTLNDHTSGSQRGGCERINRSERSESVKSPTSVTVRPVEFGGTSNGRPEARAAKSQVRGG